MLKRFAPRAASLIETGELGTLRQEMELCRHLMIGCGTLTIGGILCVAPFLLPLFGNYASAQTFLIWLAIPTFIHSFYETSDRLLIIAGQANVALLLTASSFLVLTTMPFITAPWIGLASIPVAMILSMLLLNPIVAVRVQSMFAIRTIHRRDLVFIVAGTAHALRLCDRRVAAGRLRDLCGSARRQPLFLRLRDEVERTRCRWRDHPRGSGHGTGQVTDAALPSGSAADIDLEGMPGDLPPIVISHQPLALDAVQSAAGPGAESRVEPLRERSNIADLHEFRIRGADFAMRRNIAQDGGAAVAHRFQHRDRLAFMAGGQHEHAGMGV